MNKLTVLALVCAFALGACLPAAPTNSAPAVDIAGTVASIGQTAAAQTLAAQPSPTVAPVLDTVTPPVIDASATSTTIINTDTPQANLTTTPATATSGTENPVSTATATSTATLSGTSPIFTPTLGVLTYGTLPPANTPYTQITLINKSRSQAYISLQVVTDQGYTIIEYPVKGTIKVRIPAGSYTYVAWVGGRQFTGYFSVSKNDQPTITLFKDKVTVSKGSVSYP